MNGRNSGAVAIFIGCLLIVIFVVGLVLDGNPGALQRKYRYDYALEQFGAFCSKVWLPAGIIGIPLFLVSLIISLAQDKKDRDKEQQ